MLMFGDGSGYFEREMEIEADGVPYNIVLADFNDDQILDIAASDFPNDRIQVLLNKEYSEILDPLEYKSAIYLEVGQHPIALLSSDINDDGSTDLLSLQQGSNEVSVFLSNRDGSFEQDNFTVGELPYAGAFGEISDDRFPRSIYSAFIISRCYFSLGKTLVMESFYLFSNGNSLIA